MYGKTVLLFNKNSFWKQNTYLIKWMKNCNILFEKIFFTFCFHIGNRLKITLLCLHYINKNFEGRHNSQWKGSKSKWHSSKIGFDPFKLKDRLRRFSTNFSNNVYWPKHPEIKLKIEWLPSNLWSVR